MTYFEFYEKLNWKIIPIKQNSKIPATPNWTNEFYSKKEEFINLKESGYNIGLVTGKISNITVVDLDLGSSKVIPEEMQSLLTPTLVQETNKGFHYFYQYNPDLKTRTVQSSHFDIRNDGGQVVIPPSIIDGYSRKFTSARTPSLMTKELSSYLLSKMNNTPLQDYPSNITIPEFNFKSLKEGQGRRETFLRMGGMLRNRLNWKQTQFVLHLINSLFITPPLSAEQLERVIKYLDRYLQYDNEEFLNRILEYLKCVKTANTLEIKDALNENREKIDKALALLIDKKVLTKKGKNVILYESANWNDQFSGESQQLSYQIPYFQDWNTYRKGDMIIIGAPTGRGKTHIAMNIVHQLVKQGIKPYYLGTEAGSRYVTIAQSLGLKSGDFYSCVTSDPLQIDLPSNAVTIIDWLEQGEFKNTNQLFKQLNDQMVQKGGLLIVFVQLRKTFDKSGDYKYSFFAENLIMFYAAVACHFLYDNQEQNLSRFVCKKAREYEGQGEPKDILCEYDYRTKQLQIRKEIEEVKP